MIMGPGPAFRRVSAGTISARHPASRALDCCGTGGVCRARAALQGTVSGVISEGAIGPQPVMIFRLYGRFVTQRAGIRRKCRAWPGHPLSGHWGYPGSGKEDRD